MILPPHDEGLLLRCPLQVSNYIIAASHHTPKFMFLYDIHYMDKSNSYIYFILDSCNKSITKIGSVESCQALLQQFNIKGSYTVDRIFASEDFKQFAALDDAGLAYILKEVDVPSLFR